MKTASVSTNKILVLAAMTGAVALATGCASTSGRTLYPRTQANQTYRVQQGTVVGVNRVVLEGESGPIGMYGGGVMGSAIGGTVGGGTGRTIARAAGAVGGAIVGREVEKAATKKEALEIHIRLDNGDVIMVVQEESQGGFQDGDRVQVMTGPRSTIVSH